jgi:membrane protease YdiL (CAAX protease family)
MMSTQPAARLPWFWLLGPPALVVAILLWGRNVFAVFAAYHLGFCLVLPAIRNLFRRRLTISQHLEYLGLTGPGTTRGLALGLGLGAALGGGTILVFQIFGDVFLADQNVPAVLARWGVNQSNLPVMFWFMTLINGPAEELYWRGFVHRETEGKSQRRNTILLIAACYASYHGVTVYLLIADEMIALLFMASIFAAGSAWGWLREKTGSVWPALLSHAGATIGYMIVARPLLSG